MATNEKAAFLNWQPYGAIPCVVLERFEAAPMLKAARVRVTKAQGSCLEGEVYTVRDDAVTDTPPDYANDTVDALMLAEEFISGFEDDETQEGIGDILAGLRAAIPRETAAPDMLAALHAVMRCARGELERPVTQRQPWGDAQRLVEAAIAKAESAYVIPSPVTGPYHGPSLADQLRLIAALAGTADKRGHQDQRDAVAYVETLTVDMLAALKGMTDAVSWPEDSAATLASHDIRQRHAAAVVALAKAEGRAS
ncbi:hypothetical protein [Mesorhizobium silamurunense]|uniref:hypothetical protein n=1 Tax=Mesorhizobium silamurunense TaxID=499528 RepID=UPI001784B0A8|nr:hypothetical protein [Mesorhizobium silamurunense]